MNKHDRQIKVAQLVALVTVADEGSFSAAALQLGLAQSTVSHAIATLETALGVVLLLRNRSGAVLTPIGMQICQQARDVLAQVSAIEQTAAQVKELKAGRVRVAAVRTVATHILPEAISTFRRQHSGLSVEILEYDIYADVEQAIRDGKVDLGFTLLPTSAEFQTWEIFREPFVALLPLADGATEDRALEDKTLADKTSLENKTLADETSKKHPKPRQRVRQRPHQKPLTWQELSSYSRIVNTRSVAHNNFVSEHLERFGCRMSVDYSVREDSTTINLVEKGLGVAILARLEAKPVPKGVRVRPLPETLERAIGVAVLEDAILPRVVFAFLDVLLALPGDEV